MAADAADAAQPRHDGGPVTVDGLIADVTREREILAALAEQGEVVERLTSSIAESVYTLEVLPSGELVPRFRSESFTALTGGEPPTRRTRRGPTGSTRDDRPTWPRSRATPGRSSTG